MSSYGDDLRCKDVHASASVEAKSLKVAAGGKFNVPITTTKPNGDATTPGSTAGVPGDLQFVVSATPANNGVYVCTAGTGGGTGNEWTLIGQKN